jgi:hypothetical protein
VWTTYEITFGRVRRWVAVADTFPLTKHIHHTVKSLIEKPLIRALNYDPDEAVDNDDEASEDFVEVLSVDGVDIGVVEFDADEDALDDGGVTDAGGAAVEVDGNCEDNEALGDAVSIVMDMLGRSPPPDKKFAKSDVSA